MDSFLSAEEVETTLVRKSSLVARSSLLLVDEPAGEIDWSDLGDLHNPLPIGIPLAVVYLFSIGPSSNQVRHRFARRYLSCRVWGNPDFSSLLSSDDPTICDPGVHRIPRTPCWLRFI